MSELSDMRPLTLQQRWMLKLQAQGEWDCVLRYALRLSGALDVAALERSLTALRQAHDVLRMRIVSAEGGFAQRMDLPTDISLLPVLVHGALATEREENAEHYCARIGHQRVDVVAGPLFDVRILRLAPDEHVLVVGLHRVMLDCFSAGLLFRQLWQSYEHCRHGRKAELPRGGSYGDYASWQQGAQTAWLRKHGAYWERKLADVSSTAWPVEAGSRAGSGIGRISRRIGVELTARLRNAAREACTWMSFVMLSCYVALLWRWGMRGGFVVPFSIAGRQPEQHETLGLFAHVVYLRFAPTGRETFAELLREVSREVIQMLPHEDFGRMAVHRPELLRGMLFQWTPWNQESDMGLPEARNDGAVEVAITPFRVTDWTQGITALPPGSVDLELSLYDSKDDIHMFAVHRGDRLTAASMERLLEEMAYLSERFVSGPQCALQDVP